jgi:prepilin-type N-terminal cleavage/methylation domain-containing protein
VNKSRGFSLVEMAIVLVIAGLLISAAITLGAAQIASSRILTTKDRQAAVKASLITFILRNNRLPCPAVPTLSDLDAGYGFEAATPGACAGVPSGSGSSIGILPWKTLGLSSDAANDGYYSRFTYAVTTSQTNLNANTLAGMRGSMSIHSAAPVSSVNQINNCTPAGWTYNPCSAVVVIISHGALGNGAYTESGQRIDLPLGPDELENTNLDSAFVDKGFAENQVNSYNDLVMALDPGDLLLPITTNGAVKDYQAKIQKDFGVIVGAVSSKAVTGRTNTAPGTRTYTIQPNLVSLNLPASSTTDPWGSTYEYTRVATDITSATANGTAFTISSSGPNNITGDADDIVETVMVSDMQSIFSTYGW